MSDQVLKVLKDARKLIQNQANWTREAFARDARGNIVFHYSDSACCWCASGAIQCATDRAECGENVCHEAHDLVNEQVRALGLFSIVGLNDFTTHSTVLTVFDRAIAKKKAGLACTPNGSSPPS